MLKGVQNLRRKDQILSMKNEQKIMGDFAEDFNLAVNVYKGAILNGELDLVTGLNLSNLAFGLRVNEQINTEKFEENLLAKYENLMRLDNDRLLTKGSKAEEILENVIGNDDFLEMNFLSFSLLTQNSINIFDISGLNGQIEELKNWDSQIVENLTNKGTALYPLLNLTEMLLTLNDPDFQKIGLKYLNIALIIQTNLGSSTFLNFKVNFSSKILIFRIGLNCCMELI